MNLEDIKKHLDIIQHSLDEINKLVSSNEGLPPQKTAAKVSTPSTATVVSQPPSYRELDGVVGIFDGFQMISDDGTKHEVPANYAAKSKLVFGDKLKMITEDGKNIFKHITKVPRQKVEGMLSRREDKWYFVSDSGSYLVSSTAADFQRAAEGDEAVALMPEDLTNVTFATLDRVIKPKPTENLPQPIQAGIPAPVAEKPKPVLPAEFNPRQISDEDLR